MAKSFSLTPQHISVIERNKKSPSLVSLAKIAGELRDSTDYLINGKQNVITDPIPVIKSDSKLTLPVKKALVTLVQELSGK